MVQHFFVVCVLWLYATAKAAPASNSHRITSLLDKSKQVAADSKAIDPVAGATQQAVAIDELSKEYQQAFKLEEREGLPVRGPPGPAGERGPAGSPGPRGPTGADNLLSGPRGLQGERGQPGPDRRGRQGPEGVKGEAGAQGSQGPAGEPGPRGELGPRGPSGGLGTVGDAGPRGQTGQRGAQGPKGESGLVGLEGPRGRPGKQGEEGPPGVRGDGGTIKDGGLLRSLRAELDQVESMQGRTERGLERVESKEQESESVLRSVEGSTEANPGSLPVYPPWPRNLNPISPGVIAPSPVQGEAVRRYNTAAWINRLLRRPSMPGYSIVGEEGESVAANPPFVVSPLPQAVVAGRGVWVKEESHAQEP